MPVGAFERNGVGDGTGGCVREAAEVFRRLGVGARGVRDGVEAGAGDGVWA